MTPEEQRKLNAHHTNRLRDLRRRIGGNIHEWRTRRRYTIDTLARRTGFSTATIDRLEIGRGDIGLEHMMRIADAMGIGIEELVRDPTEVA